MEVSKAYEYLAEAYQSLMEVDYDEWMHYLQRILHVYAFGEKTLLDGGCGTGAFSRRFAAEGWQVIGVDQSAAMLNVAWQQPMRRNLHYVQQDLVELELEREFSVILCACDVINYIIDLTALQQVFQRIYGHLSVGGVFLFDVSSPYKLKHILGNHTFAETQEHCPYIWENTWDEALQTVTMDMTLFKPQHGNLYLRQQERHVQKAWPVEILKTTLQQVGFEQISFFKAFTLESPDSSSERLQCVATKGHNS